MSSPSEQTILVTGANGYLAGHIIKLALEMGYNVRGAVRSAEVIPKLGDTFARYARQLTFAIVPDITKPEQFEKALDDSVTGVIHTASPFVFEVEDRARDILDPAIQGSVAILEATRLYGRSVRRIVTTSSFAAIIDPLLGHRPGHVYTEQDWNPLSYDQGLAADWGAVTYTVSKSLSEKAMWDWMDSRKPSFTLTALNPPWVFGPHVPPLETVEKLNQSTAMVHRLLDASEVPATDFAGFVDVRDVAIAHMSAYEKEEAAGQRLLLGGHFDYQSAVDVLREEVPELNARLPLGEPGAGWAEDVYSIDASKAERVLGLKYTSLGECMRDTFKELVEAEGKQGR